jgi:hypothetical protein
MFIFLFKKVKLDKKISINLLYIYITILYLTGRVYNINKMFYHFIYRRSKSKSTLWDYFVYDNVYEVPQLCSSWVTKVKSTLDRWNNISRSPKIYRRSKSNNGLSRFVTQIAWYLFLKRVQFLKFSNYFYLKNILNFILIRHKQLLFSFFITFW